MENAQHDPHPLGSIWLCTRVTSDPTPSTSPQSKDEGKSFCRATHRECGRGPTTLCFDGSTSYGGFLGTDMEAEAMPRIAIAAAAAAIVDARHLEAILSIDPLAIWVPSKGLQCIDQANRRGLLCALLCASLCAPRVRGGGGMKQIGRRDVNSDGVGSIRVQPDSSEDMWHLYNVISEGDVVTSVTFRKVDLSSPSAADAGGGGSNQRIKLVLPVAVESIEYDGEAAEMRLRGRVTSEVSDHVRVGSYHTLTIARGRALTIEKREPPGWDLFALETLSRACDPKAALGGADVAVLLVDEGFASLHLVGTGGTSLRCAKIETRMPKKFGAAAAGIRRAQEKFYDRCAAAIAQHVDFSEVQCLVLAGPGFTKDELRKHIMLEGTRVKSSGGGGGKGQADGGAGQASSMEQGVASIAENKAKVICVVGYIQTDASSHRQ